MITIPAPDDDRILRRVKANDHTLIVWDTYKTNRLGKSRLGYALIPPGATEPMFIGENFYASPCHAIDSDEILRAILSFLTLRPGDTDSDYFADYTPEQLAWADQYAEELSLWADDEDPPPFEDIE